MSDNKPVISDEAVEAAGALSVGAEGAVEAVARRNFAVRTGLNWEAAPAGVRAGFVVEAREQVLTAFQYLSASIEGSADAH